MHVNGMSRSVLNIERIVVARAMIGPARHLLNMLMQRATEYDVQFLESAADAKHRFAGRDRGLQKRQRGGIAMLVLHHAVSRRSAAIMSRRNVGRRTCEEQSVDGFEQFVSCKRRIQHRYEKRQSTRTVAHRRDVFLSHKMKGVL